MVINTLWTGITGDYVELNLLRMQLQQTEATLFPAWLISVAAWGEFGFNQLNDPVEVLSLMVMGFKLIDAYYTFSQKPAGPVLDDSIVVADNKSDAHSHSLLVAENKKYDTYTNKLLTPGAKKSLGRDGLHASPQQKPAAREPEDSLVGFDAKKSEPESSALKK